MIQIIRQNIVTLIHSLASTVLFAALLLFFIDQRPDPDYNDLLSVLIGGLVTIVTVMFSAVLVALQLASAQFSPRITRAFFGQNKRVQAAFYLFLFGIAYCFAIKFTYSSAAAAFRYPWLPVSGAVFGFFLISFVLPRFVFYIADAINAASISRDIAHRTVQEIDDLYGMETWLPGMPEEDHLVASPKVSCARVRLQEAGFLDKIHHHRLNKLARQYPEMQFYCELIVGNFVTPGETAVKIVANNGVVPAGVAQQIAAAFEVNKYRSYDQDVLFGVRQLVDMGIKAISPAVNDPTTCVNCMHYLGVIIRRYAHAVTPSVQVREAPGNIRYREFNFEMLLDASFDQIFQWGRHDYVIVSQMLNTYTELLQSIDRPRYRELIIRQVEALELSKLHFEIAEQQERVQKNLNRFRAEAGA